MTASSVVVVPNCGLELRLGHARMCFMFERVFHPTVLQGLLDMLGKVYPSIRKMSSVPAFALSRRHTMRCTCAK